MRWAVSRHSRRTTVVAINTKFTCKLLTRSRRIRTLRAAMWPFSIFWLERDRRSFIRNDTSYRFQKIHRLEQGNESALSHRQGKSKMPLFSVAEVKAKSFDENHPVRYDLFENTAANAVSRNRTRSDTFTIDERIGVIHLKKELDYDSGQQPRSYSLKGNRFWSSWGYRRACWQRWYPGMLLGKGRVLLNRTSSSAAKFLLRCSRSAF